METKQEFIDGLRRALTGKISQPAIEEHIRYYDDYITAEARQKGSEKAVLDILGDPRLIAMSICAAQASQTKAEDAYWGSGAYEGNDGYGNAYKGYEEAYGQREEADKRKKDDRPFILRHPKLTISLILIGIVLVIILVLALAFSLLKFLWPVIVVVIIVALIIRLIAENSK